MKLSKRSCVVVVLGGIAATAAVAVPSGSAQAPGATTLSFYEPDAQSTFKIIDNPPKDIRQEARSEVPFHHRRQVDALERVVRQEGRDSSGQALRRWHHRQGRGV